MHIYRFATLFCPALIVASLPLLCRATVATNRPIKDTTLYQDASGAVANGAGSYVFAGKTQTGSIRRGLIQFDLTGTIPAGSVITHAELFLQMSRTSAGALSVSLHHANAEWGEGTSNADAQEGSGAPATAGDATWLHTFYSNAFWAVPGGTFTAQPGAGTMVAGIGRYVWSSDQMVTDVQAWLDNNGLNFGWILIGDESGNGTAKRFNSRENVIAATQPQLVTTYVIPEPGYLSLVLTLMFIVKPGLNRL